MCNYILGAVPSNSDIDSFTEVCIRHGFYFDLVQNNHLTKKLDSKIFGRLTRDHCDCESWLGKEFDYDHLPGKNLTEELKKKYRRKGWSASKIERAVQDALKHSGLTEDEKAAGVKPFRDLFNDVLLPGKIGRLGVLMHNYSGSIVDEDFEFEVENMRLNNCNVPVLLNMRQDVFYDISN